MGLLANYCREVLKNNGSIENARNISKDNFDKYKVYPASLKKSKNTFFFMAKKEDRKVLVIYGDDKFTNDFEGNIEKDDDINIKICSLSINNCKALSEIFPFMKPANHKGKAITIGLGDRLGYASNGHIKTVEDKDVFPVLAQQSIRELNLTGRTYEQVLSDAAWAVFQEGYEKGYGADGDHLKTDKEIRYALDCGFTMLTLDCSEHINNDAASYGNDKILSEYDKLDNDLKNTLEKKYLDNSFKINDNYNITFSKTELAEIVLVYYEAVKYTIKMYDTVIKPYNRNIDFEMSIDETLSTTSPQAHFFVAKELLDEGVDITSLAPRFCGEFQKGIDYIGNIEDFKKEFKEHALIADFFGYKISVHSGSDKFSAFPYVGSLTNMRFHLKTAGTNWLEAIRVIAKVNPSLYRKMHKYAFLKADEARKYYHIKGKEENVPDIDSLTDEQLPELMDKDDSRQIIHITYGVLLSAKNKDGSLMFKDEFLKTLFDYEEEYKEGLKKHIGKHLKYLGV